jgi:hypothetical protein
MSKKTQNCIGQTVELTAPYLEVKRFHTEGAHFEYICPKCNHKHKRELDGDSINYPVIGEPYQCGEFWCSQCDHEWDPKITLTFSLSVIGHVNHK